LVEGEWSSAITGGKRGGEETHALEVMDDRDRERSIEMPAREVSECFSFLLL
jgi:hypothetical protein